MAMVRTREEVKAEFARRGLSVRAWSRENGLDAATVYNLLAGKKAVGKRGGAHKAAVLLGLKEGVIANEIVTPRTVTPLFSQDDKATSHGM